MGERKGQNMYYPPDYDPKYGGLNKFQGTHALRERAKKLHLGILIIRFEMPYNIWCDGCGNHIGMGVRYNAEKTKVSLSLDTAVLNRNGIGFLLSGRHVLHDSGVPVQVQVPPLSRLHRDENGPREFGEFITAVICRQFYISLFSTGLRNRIRSTTARTALGSDRKWTGKTCHPFFNTWIDACNLVITFSGGTG